ncbi:MAG: L-threonylcarbamoyladenylate synthase [Thermoleophilia bacterium]|nr:L-threonylcarbamoyladenylate synthase [Thermoleophilia bacterium]
MVEATLPGATVLTPEGLTEAELAAAREALEAGAVIGVPTDTVYGLAARWDSPAGVRALFAAKGRAPEQPVAVAFASVDAVVEALPELDSSALKVLRALLPGPYTFVVAISVPRPALVGTADSLGVRVPDCPGLLTLLRLLGVALAATSANPSGGADARTLSEVDPAVLAQCSVVFAGLAEGGAGPGLRPGPAPVTTAGRGPASTVVDLRPLSAGRAPVVLREGAIGATEVLERIATL